MEKPSSSQPHGVDDSVQRVDFANESEKDDGCCNIFPPFCVGEVRRMGGPKRREVGHSRDLEALEPMLPSKEEFPYVIRCSGDILDQMVLLQWPLYVVLRYLCLMLVYH